MRTYLIVVAAFAAALLTACAGQRGATPRGANPQPANVSQSTQMDERMRAMTEAHGRMMSAKTPEERKALMAEHQKIMREGMAAMHDSMGMMKPGAPCMDPATVQKHQAMMQMMMQMMTETPEAPAPVPAPG